MDIMGAKNYSTPYVLNVFMVKGSGPYSPQANQRSGFFFVSFFYFSQFAKDPIFGRVPDTAGIENIRSLSPIFISAPNTSAYQSAMFRIP